MYERQKPKLFERTVNRAELQSFFHYMELKKKKNLDTFHL